MKEKEIIQLRIDDIGYDGKGIAHKDGLTVFIPFVIKDELVKAQIDHINIKKNIAFASLINVIEQSKYRVEPLCKSFTRCGGCNIMHIEYSQQLKYKKESLKTILQKNANYKGEVEDVVASNKLKYRNKIQLPFKTFDGVAQFGFYEEGSHNIVPVNDCLLHDEWAANLVAIATEYVQKCRILPYDEATGKGMLRHLVARNLENTLTVTLVINGEKLNGIDGFKDALINKFKSVSLYLSVNKEKNNVIMGSKLIPVYAKEQKINVMGIDIEVNPHSFFQVNDYIRDKLYSEIINKLNPDKDTVIIDAYSGVGLLGAIMAKKGAYIYNIEIVAEATKDAQKLYTANGLEKNVENITGDAAIELSKLFKRIKKGGKRINIILDPPRKGVDNKVIEAILTLDTDVSLTYISCNPATLSRDIKLLSERFECERIIPYDMFPNTHHIETLVFFR